MRRCRSAACMAGLAAALLLVACNNEPGPQLRVSDLDVRAPRAGMNMGAAYLTLHNNSNQAIRITGFASPQFESIELHESILEDGISRMRKLEELTIDPGATVALEPGGRHLMLLRPLAQDAATFDLKIYAGDAMLLAVSGTMEHN